MTLDDIDFVLNRDFYVDDQTVLFDKTEKGKIILNSEIDIDGLPGCEYRLYRFDPEKGELFPFFSKERGRNLKSICDFFVFVSYNGALYAVLIEHKSGSGSSNTQLEASECFVKYIQSTLKRIGRDDTCRIIKVRLHVLPKKQNKMSSPKYENDVLCYYWNKFRIKAIIEKPNT
ncbi:MAG: hypothetical protein SPL42_10635 [Bacteroidales bacterium]|nr:hypothetical protein [Bacteroidales bacterium]